MNTTTHQIRKNFLEFFKNKGHAVIPSSPVVPYDDPTLLFINAGMNQFKDVFLGKSHRDYTRAVSSQKCIRVGGKHNDLENVGHTRRHLTFFEMLGNFSFGDYFKADAIKFAWEVSTEVFGFEADRIYPTVFREDDEAFEIWTSYVPASKITRFDEKDNFWMMGDQGPCGPCSELLYDRGDAFGKARNPSEDPSGERFMEFWNLVFMQYNRQDGKQNPLPKPSIDTGAGLERIMSLKMGVDSVFETDILRGLIGEIENIFKIKYHFQDDKAPAFRVIADHMRALSFSIADGVQPSNVDRGYVLRKILRRAVRYGRKLNAEKPFLADLVPTLIQLMGEDYPELKKNEARIKEILTLEEESFLKTLKRGGNLLNQIVSSSKEKISGDDAFKLKDTYGFPLEEILLIAKDNALAVDLPRFEKLEEDAKEKSRSVKTFEHETAKGNLFENLPKTQFIGYTELAGQGSVIALLKKGQFVEEIQEGEEGIVILDKTPFYAEMGGQVGDKGNLKKSTTLFEVHDTKAPFKGVHAHLGVVKNGVLKKGDQVLSSVDPELRLNIGRNHTATHLLHLALRKVLGEHIKQAGSVVDAERLRFDFSHHKSLTRDELFKIEELVNREILKNLPVKAYELPYEQAMKRSDIIQFFGEKYGSIVRVIDIEESKELCGGTHLSDLGFIGSFKIVKEGSIAAGVRRIEAVTGIKAFEFARSYELKVQEISEKLKCPAEKVDERIETLINEKHRLEDEFKKLKKEGLKNISKALLETKETFSRFSAVIAKVSYDPEDFKILADLLQSSLQEGILILGNTFQDKASLLIRVSSSVPNADAGKMIKEIAPLIEGTGGGKADSAQAGGKNPAKLDEALSKGRQLLQNL